MGAQAEGDLGAESVPGLVGEVPAGTELRRTGRLRLVWPPGFSLDRTVRSHGWCGLAPNAYDRAGGRFHRTLELPDAGPLTVTVHADGLVTWGRVAGTRRDRAVIQAQLSRMLCLDDDLAELHAACLLVPGLAWVPACGAGRILRSPTVWEDLARTLATTNCSWALTRAMVRRLVETLGARGSAGEQAFPTPASVAAAGVGHLREVVRAGYRAESFVALAGTQLEVESWLPAGGS
ncbi:MAG: DNA glycosylase family protein, partial [Mycobacteriales bacterium]